MLLSNLPARAATFVRNHLRQRFANRVRTHANLELDKVGSGYGGWIVPAALIRPDWTCYCGGVGEDITFDLGLIERFGCTVFAFDPTPRSISYVAEHASGQDRFHFLPVGLWSEDTTLKFYVPKDPTHVSHSAVNLQKTNSFFEANCASLRSLMAKFGHSAIDLLKIDIEGAEHAVVDSMMANAIRPKVVCIEIDLPVSPFRFAQTINRLQVDYELVSVDGWNFTFIRRDLVESST